MFQFKFEVKMGRDGFLRDMCQMGEGNQSPQVITIPQENTISWARGHTRGRSGLCQSWQDSCLHMGMKMKGWSVKGQKATNYNSFITVGVSVMCWTLLDISDTNVNMKYILRTRSSQSGRKYKMQIENDHPFWKVKACGNNLYQADLVQWEVYGV